MHNLTSRIVYIPPSALLSGNLIETKTGGDSHKIGVTFLQGLCNLKKPTIRDRDNIAKANLTGKVSHHNLTQVWKLN